MNNCKTQEWAGLGDQVAPQFQMESVSPRPSARGCAANARQGWLAEMVFVARLRLFFAGARAAANGTRQMLFRAGSFEIDVQVEAKPGSLIQITGQVLDVSRPDIRASGLHAVLRNRRGSTLYTLTNEFGEFQFEVKNPGDLELTLSTDEKSSIVISLGDPLEDFAG